MSSREIYEQSFDESVGSTVRDSGCPECPGRLRTVDGETSCVECRLVVDVDRLARTRPPNYEDGRYELKRTGKLLTETRHDRGLSTKIGYKRDGTGKWLSSNTRRKFRRLRTQQNRAAFDSKGQRNLAAAFTEIARLRSGLELPWSLREQACSIYRSAHNEDLIVGRSIESMAAVSLYAACRCSNHHRTLKELADRSPFSQEKVEHAYSVLNRELGLEAMILRPSMLLGEIASNVECSEHVHQRARELANIAAEAGISNGRSPAGVAAACVYLVSNEQGDGLTQAEVASVAGTSTVTLGERNHELRKVV